MSISTAKGVWFWGTAILLSLLFVLSPGLASAHSLKVFARVEGGYIGGYAFFVGGGRPSGVEWFAVMGDVTVARGTTGTDGSYQFAIPSQVDDDVVITVDTREGHIASTRINATRLQTIPTNGRDAGDADMPGAKAPFLPVKPMTGSRPESIVSAPPLDGTAIESLVEQAVQRQIGPLLERIETMDARMRLTDILSGIFLIIGLAGIGLWARRNKR